MNINWSILSRSWLPNTITWFWALLKWVGQKVLPPSNVILLTLCMSVFSSTPYNKQLADTFTHPTDQTLGERAPARPIIDQQQVAQIRTAIFTSSGLHTRTVITTYSYFVGSPQKDFNPQIPFWQASSTPLVGLSFECRAEKSFGVNSIGFRVRHDIEKNGPHYWPTKTLLISSPRLPRTLSIITLVIIIDGTAIFTQGWAEWHVAYIPLPSQLEQRFKRGRRLTARISPESMAGYPSSSTAPDALELHFDLTGTSWAVDMASACGCAPMLDGLFYIMTTG